MFSAVVFNAGQMSGLPPIEQRLVFPEWERHELAEAIAANSGVSIVYQNGDRVCYSVQADRITMPERGQFPTADRFYGVQLHETVHGSGHPSRLGRDLMHPFGSEMYAKEELRAEIASMMLGETLGIGHDPAQHVAYIDNWIKALRSDPREIFARRRTPRRSSPICADWNRVWRQRKRRVHKRRRQLLSEAALPR